MRFNLIFTRPGTSLKFLASFPHDHLVATNGRSSSEVVKILPARVNNDHMYRASASRTCKEGGKSGIRGQGANKRRIMGRR